MHGQIAQLITLLDEAANLLLELGHKKIPDSDYYTDDLGHFCSNMCQKILHNTIDQKEKKKLYNIFYPAHAWYAAIDDTSLGNMIYELVEELYIDDAL